MSNLIELSDIQFSWLPSQPPIIDIPKLTIKRGERIFISGDSGSGKSTLLSLIGGVNLPQSGSISVIDKPLHTLGNAQRDLFRADHIGFIFQIFNLIPYLSVIDNVTLPCFFSKKRKQNIQQSSLEDEAIRLLSDLRLTGDIIYKPVTQLSTGQQQRVAAARALMGKPELIIADEPTSSLDTDRRADFINLLFEECDHQDTTLLFVSHDKALESLFHHTISLADINQAATVEDF
ncbi:MAG: ABC transporter ATP-binding protein [Methylococcales bacterium]|jgi:putative ABC transport system ATP-binding protein|nr:ABC transporter ATP-binding protein [Methylococcales bacterium]MBT7444242.1 ABC transporter ATP-binding protein [Methylococcales bacterium]